MAHEAVAGGSPVGGGLAGWTIRVLAACAQFGGIAWPASIPPHAVLSDVLSKMESTLWAASLHGYPALSTISKPRRPLPQPSSPPREPNIDPLLSP